MGSINDYFDGIYCINLDRRPDRWEKNCLPQFEKLGMSVERFSATDGKNFTFSHGKAYNGELAGSYSHLNAIKKAREEGVKRLLLLEDDVVFSDNINESFSKLIKNVPDKWDILFFGGNHVRGFMKVAEGVVKLGGSYAIHACGIDEKAYDIMIQHLENKINKVESNKEKRFTPSVAADYFLADLHKVLDVYCFKPHIAWQLDDYSDIQHANVKYDFLK